jgi:hypothetical protein
MEQEPVQKKIKSVSIPVIPILSKNDSRSSGNIYHKKITNWQRDVRNTFREIPVEQISIPNIKLILSGFSALYSGDKSVLRWRVSRLLSNLPVIQSNRFHVLGAKWIEPTISVKINNEDPQTGFRHLLHKDLLKYKIIPQLDVETLMKLMYTCKMLYLLIHPIVCERAKHTFGFCGTPMYFSLDRYLNMSIRANTLATSRIRERLGFKRNEKQPSARKLNWRKTGYIDHLRDNNNQEQHVAKRQESEFVEFSKFKRIERIDRFNTFLCDNGYSYLVVDDKGFLKNNILAQISKYKVGEELINNCFNNEWKVALIDELVEKYQVAKYFKHLPIIDECCDKNWRVYSSLFSGLRYLFKTDIALFEHYIQNLMSMLQGCAEANDDSFVVFRDKKIYFYDDNAQELSNAKYIKRSLYTGQFAIVE